MFFITLWQIRYKDEEFRCVIFTDKAENFEETIYISRELGGWRIVGPRYTRTNCMEECNEAKLLMSILLNYWTSLQFIIIVNICYHSIIWNDIIHCQNLKNTIVVLDKCFVTFGKPHVNRSYSKYSQCMGLTHYIEFLY